jgi:hypothetical protein
MRQRIGLSAYSGALRRQFPTWTLCFVVAALLMSCSTVDVRKASGREGEDVHGFRYYLSRPYLAVKKEMPVSGSEITVIATLDKGKLTVSDEYTNIYKALTGEAPDTLAPSDVQIPRSLIGNFIGARNPGNRSLIDAIMGGARSKDASSPTTPPRSGKDAKPKPGAGEGEGEGEDNGMSLRKKKNLHRKMEPQPIK